MYEALGSKTADYQMPSLRGISVPPRLNLVYSTPYPELPVAMNMLSYSFPSIAP
jgi:hypothetical protein